MRLVPLLAWPVVVLAACASAPGSSSASSSSTGPSALPSALPGPASPAFTEPAVATPPPTAVPPPITTTTTPTPHAPTATPAAGVVVAGDPDNGRVVSLRVGARLRVVLGSTYWTIAGSSAAGVLRADGAPAVSPEPSGCVPGEGCGTVAETFVALRPGRATVTASRTTCGEALACGPGNGSYSVTVVVS